MQAAPAGAVAWTGEPDTVMPWRRSAAAKTCAARSDGSGTRPKPVAGRPSSTHSAEIGATTSSVR